MIEDRPLAVVPVPQVLPMLASNNEPANDRFSLLVVANINYGSSKDTDQALANRGFKNWKTLRGMKEEGYAVRGRFEDFFPDNSSKQLRWNAATEHTFREEAPKFQWLHVATHGFFADPIRPKLLSTDSSWTSNDLNWDLALIHPEVLSGLAFTGANDSSLNGDQNDGLLTALEVTDMNLGLVEMAVLSACETGLGDIQQGEGVLGLQRAFHMAGTRSVISSLWNVNDVQTQYLMAEFYTNVWQHKMTKIEALQKAQISMIRNDSNIRGLEAEADAGHGGDEKRMRPYYWAGFVLSGDWH